MDKYEYKIKADEINRFIAEKKYKEAVAIADTIDWRNVKNTMMLCSISDLYKICRRFEDSREVLLLAYERNPNGRLILYSLCELSIKLGDVVSALESYKAFCYYAPKDTGRFILRYKLLTAQEVGLEERISVLEELQTYECKEKWMYELAYLYHMQGVSEKCVEECNQIVLYFGEGKYVIKALALKQLHEPLSAEQDELYRKLTEPQASDITIKEMDVSQYNTIDLQKELANSLAELLPNEEKPEDKKEEIKEESLSEESFTEIIPDEPVEEAVIDVSENTEEEILAEELVQDSEEKEDLTETKINMTVNSDSSGEKVSEETRIFNINEIEAGLKKEKVYERAPLSDGQIRLSDMMEIFPEPANASVIFPTYDDMVSIEGDGQISMNIPSENMVEKQITGQISIDEVLAEWERMKSANEKKWADDMRKKAIDKTTDLLKDFDVTSRDGLLERLESEVENSETVTLTEEEEKHLLDEEKEDGLAIEIVAVGEEIVQVEEEANEESDEVAEEESETSDIREIFAEPAEEEITEETHSEESETEGEPEEPTEEELSFDRTEFTGIEPELTEEMISKEPESEDNTVALPKLEEIDYLLAFAEAAEKSDLENLSHMEDIVPDVDAVCESAEEETIEENITEEDATVEESTEKESEEKEESEEAEPETEEEEEPLPEIKVRESGFTEEQEERFEAFIQTEEAREQLKEALENISMEPGHGNIIIGSEDLDSSVELAKAIMMEISATEGITGKVAKTKASTLNAKDAEETLLKLVDGALIIQDANELRKETLEAIRRVVLSPDIKMFIVLTATKRAKHHFIMENRDYLDSFNVSIDIDPLSNGELVAYAKGYAHSKEYAIDEMGTLALHTRIDEKQTNEHSVNIKEVKDIVDAAILKSNRKTVKHFFDTLVGKRYDENSMIVLTEKDFVE